MQPDSARRRVRSRPLTWIALRNSPRRMRASSVRWLLIYCAGYRCSHSISINADHWSDEMRLYYSDTSRLLRVWDGSFVARYALVNQKAFVSWAVHQGSAFFTSYVSRERFRHGNFVFGFAAASVRSGLPFDKFGHAWNMRLAQLVFQPGHLP
jgi:hypothetical protein